MAYSGKFKPKNPDKYVGDVNNIIWRSTWECKYASYLDKNPNVLSWSSEQIVIPYKDPLDGRRRRYFVDFWMKVKTSDGSIKEFLVEIKPKKQTMEPEKKSRVTKKYVNEIYTFAVNTAKWKAAREFCKHKNWTFQLLTEDDFGF